MREATRLAFSVAMLGGALLAPPIGLCAQPADAAVPHELLAEPGYQLAAGRWLLPVTGLDRDGRPVVPAPGTLHGQVDGQPLVVQELLATVPTAILVISDQFLPAVAWGSAAVLLPASPHWLGVRRADATSPPLLTVQPAAGLPLPGDLAAPMAPRVWDAVLAGIRELAVADGAPERRVILVLGDLREEAQSLHPMAACLEAARELSIVVVGAVVGDAEPAAVARLRHLADSTGGSLVTAASPLAALMAGLYRVEAARGLVVAGPDLSLPVPVTIAVTGGPTVQTLVAFRPAGRYTPGPGLVAAVAVLLGAGAGLVAWQQWRRRPVGFLVSTEPTAAWRRAVPAAGLTIGRAPDCGLRLAENRVSKHHAQVRWHRGQVQLIDLRSTNGTQVGGQPVRTAALQNGDEIVFGDAVTVQFQRRRPGKG